MPYAGTVGECVVYLAWGTSAAVRVLLWSFLVFLSFFLLVVRLIFLLVERPQVQIPALRPYVPSRDLWVVRSRTLSAWRAFCLVSVMPAGRNISLLRSRTEM